MSNIIPTRREIISQVFSFSLGIASSSSATYGYVLISIIILLYLLVVVGLPKVHPGILLEDTQNQITDMRIWLNREATTRLSYRMFGISARGLHSLTSIEKHVETLLSRHEKDCTIHNTISYLKSLPKLVKEARKCQADLASLRSNLEDEVRRLNDDSDIGPGEYNYLLPVAP